MLGTIVNAMAIVMGVIVGLWFGKKFSENIRKMIMQAVGLGVILIGLKMAITTEQLLIVLVSMVLGAWLGEATDIEGRLHSVGSKLEKMVAGNKGGKSNVAQAFVTSTLLYCVGAMAIMGAIESGLTGKHDILFAKSLLDGITAIMLTTTLGFGVAFSAVSVLIYQGFITLTAIYMQYILTDPIIVELKAVGGLLILGIGLNLLEITKIKVGNLLPALLFVVILMLFAGNMSFL